MANKDEPRQCRRDERVSLPSRQGRQDVYDLFLIHESRESSPMLFASIRVIRGLMNVSPPDSVGDPRACWWTSAIIRSLVIRIVGIEKIKCAASSRERLPIL